MRKLHAKFPLHCLSCIMVTQHCLSTTGWGSNLFYGFRYNTSQASKADQGKVFTPNLFLNHCNKSFPRLISSSFGSLFDQVKCHTWEISDINYWYFRGVHMYDIDCCTFLGVQVFFRDYAQESEIILPSLLSFLFLFWIKI